MPPDATSQGVTRSWSHLVKSLWGHLHFIPLCTTLRSTVWKTGNEFDICKVGLLGVLQWPSWSYSSSFNFSLLGIIISQVLVSIPPFFFFHRTFLSSPPVLLPMQYYKHFSFLLLKKKPHMFPPCPRLSTLSYVTSPGRRWDCVSSFPLHFFSSFFVFLTICSAVFGSAANENKNRSSDVCHTNVLLNRPVFRSSI